MFGITAFAEPAANAAAGQMTTMDMVIQFVPFIVVIVLLYFMMIRPQRKREKEAKAMLSAMKVGDKVVTIGGICGKITKLKDDYVIIETGSTGNPNEKSYIKMERNAIRDVEKKAEA